ncbi:G2/M phase-specific E3 ubiquitin-protein ligase-like [Uranotaenia lowii]|uniref:G2/M phase-specific E3 ubiquitin-protein ligase-like n=1 Tax=Uranotaenia lowii TaxID=190385 RepID=UPI00247AA0C8|nr:G2/M phase-specific E3 ubiquitin-protein ligase-like [Uranotaenia lowii]
MNIDDDLLSGQDNPYFGIDRLRFMSCRCCARNSPFLFYLPPSNDFAKLIPGLQLNQLIFCVHCLPPVDQLRECYPEIETSIIKETNSLDLFKGFEYANPYYRKYAKIDRIIITDDTLPLNIPCDEMIELEQTEKLDKLIECFPTVHRLENRRYQGLEEIGQLLFAKSQELQNYYREQRGKNGMIAKRIETLELNPEDDVEVAVEDHDNLLPMETGEISEDSLPNQLIQFKNQIELTMTEDIVDKSLCQEPFPYVVADPRFKLNVLDSSSEHLCDICLLSDKSRIKYGEFIEKPFARKTIRCHYFCLLSGHYLNQQGMDSSGILGFLLDDIMNSFKHYRSIQCYYCGKLSAPVKCSHDKCTRWYHYSCGYKNSCVTQFADQFNSFCHEHLPFQHPESHGPDTLCLICWNQIGPYNPVSSFCSICEPEEENSVPEIIWYHRACMQRSAFASGYYFKCPNCHDKEFVQYARLHGIFVPQRDASWELETGAFKDLHSTKCTAADCRFGSKASGKGSSGASDLVGCKACGGATMHTVCAQLDNPDDYVCSNCMDATFIKLF